MKYLFPLFQYSVLSHSKNFTNIMDMKLVSTNKVKIETRICLKKTHINICVYIYVYIDQFPVSFQ